jgi:outer membrane protein TolC
LDLKMNIQRGLSALRIALGAFDLALQDLEASREMVRVSETMMEAGRMESRELEESRVQMQQREQALIEADLSVIERKLELLRAIGSVDSALR